MPAARNRPPVEAELVQRVAWLIRLRWLAPVGIVAVTFLAPSVTALSPAWPPLVGTALLIALYNLAFAGWWAQLQKRPSLNLTPYNWLANSQVAADWLALTFLLHWTGGIESPLAPVYILHIVVACVLLSPRAAFAQATVASLLLVSLAVLEYGGLWPHRPLVNYLPVPLYDRPAYVIAVLFFLPLTLYISAFLATSVTHSLRRQDLELLSLQTRLEDRNRRTRALYETAVALASSLRLEEVLNQVVRTATEIMNAKGCSIRLLSADGTQLEVAAAYGLSEDYWRKGPVLVARSLLDQETLQGKTVIVLNAADDPRLQYRQELAQEGICSILCAPLVVRGRPIGVIRIYSAVCYLYSSDDASFLEAIAGAGAAAIDNARAYRQLEELDQAKTRFVHLVAHELRSPLAAIQSLLDVITGGYAGPIGEQGTELLQRAERRVQFLLLLVNDLLDLAAGRTDRLQRDRSPVDLRALTEQTIGLLQPRAQDKGVILNLTFAPVSYELQGIPDHLGRLLTNLVDNAIKYTPAGGQVKIDLRQEEGELVLTVADTGIGVPAEALPHLFEEFYRAPNARSLVKEGTGLGLAIAKQVIDEHYGRVSVQSHTGAGTSFTVRLPIAPPSGAQSATREAPSKL
jgi:signal transduction histidine kinase